MLFAKKINKGSFANILAKLFETCYYIFGDGK